MGAGRPPGKKSHLDSEESFGSTSYYNKRGWGRQNKLWDCARLRHTTEGQLQTSDIRETLIISKVFTLFSFYRRSVAGELRNSA